MNETAEIAIEETFDIGGTRQKKDLMYSCLLGAIWFTHATVPAIMYRFGTSIDQLHIMSKIAWQSFVWSRIFIYGSLFILWTLAFIIIKDDIFAGYYYKGWVFL